MHSSQVCWPRHGLWCRLSSIQSLLHQASDIGNRHLSQYYNIGFMEKRNLGEYLAAMEWNCHNRPMRRRVAGSAGQKHFPGRHLLYSYSQWCLSWEEWSMIRLPTIMFCKSWIELKTLVTCEWFAWRPLQSTIPWTTKLKQRRMEKQVALLDYFPIKRWSINRKCHWF